MKQYEFPSLEQLEEILQRPILAQENLDKLLLEIFLEVKNRGDEALKEYAFRYDKVKLSEIKVSEQEIKKAIDSVDQNLKDAITQAYNNIFTFHESQVEKSVKIETMPGVFCWRKSVGIDKVGLYIPGGSAPLFSTILMLAIPAKIANCKEIILCTPSDSSGKIHPAILFTANLCGITKIYKLGGIQAIAAMSLGTESVPAVYKLFGPGNQFVTAAKIFAQKYKMSIDMPAGPSEVMVVCDEFANASYVASDLLAQAEHGADSQVVLLSTSKKKIQEVLAEISIQSEQLPRKNQVLEALQHSFSILCLKENICSLINKYAPEHLILNTRFNSELIENVTNAGSIFIGEFTPESAGDYASGTNHTLPTNGYARQYSGVSVDSFVKKITYQEITAEGIKNIGKTVEIMAEAEGLLAHKNAVSIRLKQVQ
jgi:histidinol dehydrogenase